MKLKSFKKNKKLKNTLLALGAVAILGGGTVVLYKKDNLYQDNYNKIEKINQTNEIAYTINGIKVKDVFPPKERGFTVNSVECKDGVTAEWNEALWGLVNINFNNNSEISCNIDFNFKGTLVDYIKLLSNKSEEIVEDDYGNLRYIGYNPNNYVSFNNELWRIIGVMKDIENPDGTKEDRIKLIRNESIVSHSWDNTGTNGSNDWSRSTLQKVLNEGAYWNRTRGNCPSGENEATTPCDFSSRGLTNDAKNMISEVVWNLGSGRGTVLGTPSTKNFYMDERGTTVYSGNSTTWTGKVGLMYPSDYGYATSGGSTTSRSECLNQSLYNWRNNSCTSNNWLKNSGHMWTITSYYKSGTYVYNINSSGFMDSNRAVSVSNSWGYRPVIYLKSSIEIESENDGSSTSPFILKNS